MKNREGCAISETDIAKIRYELNREARIGWIERRMRAMVFISWTSSIRIGELIRLDIGDILIKNGKKWRIIETFVIREKAKIFPSGNRATGKIHLSRGTREAIRDYLVSAMKAGVIHTPIDLKSPLWLSTHRKRIAKRTVQKMWVNVQIRAGIPENQIYRWHDLRHTALTEIGQLGDVFDVQALGRFRTIKNTIRYVHPSDEHIIDLMERAQRKCRKR